MRTFHIQRIEHPGPVRLLVRDVDNTTFMGIEAPGLEMAKLQAVVAIKQVLAREEAPMPACDECHGGFKRTEDNIIRCSRQECNDWYEAASTILDRVEVTISTEGDVGEVVL